jgi:N-hydroxyarylamine O-acetyltransferase
MDLDAYLARIGLNNRPTADIHGLRTLQRAQRMAIPFENLDVVLGRGISLDPDDVFDKLVTRKRGGYCFEQNQLLGRALTKIGFETRALLGRVWVMANGIPGRTHTFECVTLDGEQWIADAGFGRGYAPPIHLIDQETVTGEDGLTHRLRTDTEHGWMLDQWRDNEWQPQYSFTLDRVMNSDLDMSNHWTSTSPKSRFVQNQIASIILPQGVFSLLGKSAAHIQGGVTKLHEIFDADTMKSILIENFGITLSRDEIETIWHF